MQLDVGVGTGVGYGVGVEYGYGVGVKTGHAFTIQLVVGPSTPELFWIKL